MEAINFAQSLTFSDPNRAYEILNELEVNTSVKKDSVYAIVLNSKGVYYSIKNEHENALRCFIKAHENAGFNKLFKIKTLSNIGISYRKQKNFIKSIETFREAQFQAKTILATEQQAVILGEMAAVYSEIQSFEKATELLLESIEILETLPNVGPAKTAIEYQKLGNLYFKMGQSDFALSLLEKSKNTLANTDRRDAYALCLTSIADVYIFRDETDLALKALEEALPIFKEFNNPEWDCYVFELFARANVLNENWVESARFFEKALEIAAENNLVRGLYTFTQYGFSALKTKNWKIIERLISDYQYDLAEWLPLGSIEDKKGYYDFMAKWYDHQKQYEKSIESYKKMIDYSDSLKALYNRNSILNLQLKYETEVKEQENTILKQELRLEKRKKWIITLISIALLVSSLLIWNYSRYQRKIKTILLQKIQLEKKNIAEQLRQAQIINEIKQKALKEREQNLLEQIMTNILLQEQLDAFVEESIAKDEKNTVQKIKNIQKKSIHWKNMLNKLQLVNPEFNQKLLAINSKITKSDVEFCSMIKMNLSTKEIALMLQINTDSVFTKKYRLLKKLQLSSETDLYTWLNSL